jgi:hypothetical protein
MPVVPSSISGLVLWLKADSGVYIDSGVTLATNGQSVAQWNDQSGNSNHATQPTSGYRPVFKTNVQNGLPSVQFTAASLQYLFNAYQAMPITVLAVFIRGSGPGEYAILGADDSSHSSVDGAYYFASAGNTGNPAQTFVQTTTGFVQALSTNGFTAITGPGVTTHLVNTTAKTVQAALNFYSPPVTSGAWTGTLVPIDTTTNKPVIGSAWYNRGLATNYANGDLCELLIYNSLLTPAQIAQLQYYLAVRWGLLAPQPTYLCAEFCNQSFTNGASNTANNLLRILSSSNGTTWSTQPISYTPNGNDCVRNPRIFQPTAGNLWLAHSSGPFAAGPYVESYFDVASSADSINWNYVASVDCSAVVGSGTGAAVWSPAWFIDSSGNPHIIVSLSSTGTTDDLGFQIYELHPTNPAMTAWSAPVALTGTALPANIIDPYLLQIGGTYYLWYKNETTKYVEVVTSTSMLSGYNTALWTGNWAAWNTIESPCPVLVGTQWYIYLSDFTTHYGGIAGSMVVSKQTAGDWTAGSSSTWSTPALFTVDGAANFSNTDAGQVMGWQAPSSNPMTPWLWTL